MGQAESDLVFNAPSGHFRQTEWEEPVAKGRSSKSGDHVYRESLFTKITRHTSLVPGSLAESEALVQGARQSFVNHRVNGITKLEASLHMLKIMVGTGILFMPQAFRATGIMLGVVMTAFIAFLSSLLNGFLVEAATYFCKLHKVPSCSYSDTARLSFQKWPKLAWLSNAAQYLITVLIFLCSYSIVIIDVAIVATNLEDICLYFNHPINWFTAVLAQLPVQIVLNTSPRMKHLTPITIGATICVWSGIGLTTGYIISTLAENNVQKVTSWNGSERLTEYLAIGLIGFNSITSLMAIENNLKNPAGFTGVPSVVCCVVCLTGALYAAYGILGYVTYGELTMGPITESIDTSEGAVALLLKFLIAIGITLTCPILFYPVLSVTSDYFIRRYHSNLFSYISRWVQVCIVVAIPLITRNITVMMELLGWVFIMLQYIMPVVIETLTFWDTREGISKFIIGVRNAILFFVGVAVTVINFYTGMRQFI